MSTFKFGDATIDLIEMASRGNAVLGIRDSGKTYTATALAERLMDGGVPICAFDPTGVWPSLRIPGAGHGYPVVIVGGDVGDLPITVKDAPGYLRAAMASGISIVFDMLDPKLSKADWKRIVMECVRILIHENKQYGLRHVIIEEAAEFVPQRVGRDQGQVYAEMEKLARIGGNSRLGFTLINQRAEEVNKAVLENCDNLFLHRQKGRLSLTALRKWLDIGNVEGGGKIISTLADLPSGQCWAWLKDGGAPILIRVPQKNSAHPDRRAMMSGDVIKARKAVDASKFIALMKARLAAPKSAATAKPAIVAASISAIKDADAKAYQRGFHEGELSGERATRELADRMLRQLKELMNTAIVRHLEILNQRSGSRARAPSPRAIPDGGAQRRSQRQHADAESAAGALSIERPLQTIIDAIAWWNALGVDAPRTQRVAFRAGYSHNSGTWRTYLSRIVSLELAVRANGCLRLTQEGAASARAPEAPPSKDELRQRVIEQIGTSLARILQPAIEAYPASILTARLAEEAGHSNSGTFRTYLSRLRSLELIVKAENGLAGHVQASPLLF